MADLCAELADLAERHARADAAFDPLRVAQLAGEALLRVDALRPDRAPCRAVRGRSALRGQDRGGGVGGWSGWGRGCGRPGGSSTSTRSVFDTAAHRILALGRTTGDPETGPPKSFAELGGRFVAAHDHAAGRRGRRGSSSPPAASAARTGGCGSGGGPRRSPRSATSGRRCCGHRGSSRASPRRAGCARRSPHRSGPRTAGAGLVVVALEEGRLGRVPRRHPVRRGHGARRARRDGDARAPVPAPLGGRGGAPARRALRRCPAALRQR